MTNDKGLKIEDFGDDLYNEVLDLISVLMALDPPLDTPLGTLLKDMADACVKYEESKFGDLKA